MEINEMIVEDLKAKHNAAAYVFRKYVKIDKGCDGSPLGLIVRRDEMEAGIYEPVIIDRRIGDVPKDEYLWGRYDTHEYVFIACGTLPDMGPMRLWRLKRLTPQEVRERTIEEIL